MMMQAISSISSQRGQSIRCLRNPAAFGCTDINYLEYDPEANVDDGGCATLSIPGCTISGYVNTILGPMSMTAAVKP